MSEETKLLVAFMTEMAASLDRKAVTTNEDREHWARVYNAENCRKIIAALSRGEAGAGDACEPSDTAVRNAADPICTFGNRPAPYPCCAGSIGAPKMCEERARQMLKLAYAIDLAPRVAVAYARGVEDAAEIIDRVADRHNEECCQCRPSDPERGKRVRLRDEFRTEASSLRALLLKEPATEDARVNEEEG